MRRVVPLALAALMASPAAAQSPDFMMNECSSAGQTYFRDFNARTEMQYNGQRVDGTHAINGRIYLETRSEDFACSYDRTGRRIVSFFAQGRNQASPPAAGAGQVTTVTVRFPAGASGTEFTEELGPGATRRYVLGARNGQDLYIRLAAIGPGLIYRILNPDGSALLGQVRGDQEDRGELWQTGNHVVEVTNRGDRRQTYTVILGIN